MNQEEPTPSLPLIDSKGREVLTPREVHERYSQAWGPLKYRELPICWHNYIAKLQLIIPLTLFAAYVWEGNALLKRGSRVRDMKTMGLLKPWAVIYGVSLLAITLDSIFFDEFCNIDSYHYQIDQNRKGMMREIRKRLRNEKD